jgi:glutathione peroxidase
MKVLLAVSTALFLAGFAFIATGNGDEKKMSSPLDVKMKGIDGKDLDLAKFKGKVVLIVNVASKCGYTKQYEGLQELFDKYEKDGLVILGVPANDFGKKEPGTDEEIKEFCSTNYKVKFPMTTKVVVKGADKTELYKILTSATPDKAGNVTEVGWNFEKFLIGRDGKVVGRYKSGVAPDSEELIKAIKTELDKTAK